MIFSLYLYHAWFYTIISGQTIIPPFTLTYGVVWEQGTPSCGHSMGKLWKMIINQWSWGIPFDHTFFKGTVGEHPPWTTMISRFPRPLRLRDFPATFHWRVCRLKKAAQQNHRGFGFAPWRSMGRWVVNGWLWNTMFHTMNGEIPQA